MESLTQVIYPRRTFIILMALTGALLAALLSLAQPLKYSAAVRLLITQRAAFTLDPYTAIRSTELIGENLAQLVKTSSFLERVLQANYGVDAQYFDLPELYKRKRWTQTIEAAQARGTGLLRITAFHPNREQALRIVAAASFLLSTQGSEYIGRDLTLRLVDPPLASKFPVRPNIPLNALSGAAIGVVFGSGWVWVEHRRKKHHGQLL